jgi:pimeloyl-ACP methyl ester carboxylesterase
LQRAVPIARGSGQPVVVYPGYLTGDISSLRLRRSLRAAGYSAYGWELGQNRGARADLLDRLGGRLEAVVDRHGEPATLVGWSLGGIFARELAKQRPDLVRAVITLGSPFSGHPRANNAWRIYEALNDHPVDKPPIASNLAEKPPVPTIAVWSPIDGIVSPEAARGQPHESDRQVELRERHLSLARAPAGIGLIGRLLAEGN